MPTAALLHTGASLPRPLPAAICFVYRDCPPRPRDPGRLNGGGETPDASSVSKYPARFLVLFSAPFFVHQTSRPLKSRRASERAFPRSSNKTSNIAVSWAPRREVLPGVILGRLGRATPRESGGILLSDHRACIALTGMISPFCTATWTRSTRTSAPANRILLPLYEYDDDDGGGGSDDVQSARTWRTSVQWKAPLCLPDEMRT